MFKLTIPPSSNWNCSHIMDCNNTGVVTYASRNDLIVIKPEVTENGHFDVRSINTAHKEKILSVILSPESSNHNSVATCSADGSVTVWDLETLSPKQSHRSHEENKKVVGLDWSYADPNLVLSVTEDAAVICWNLESNTIRRLPSLTRISPLCLACNPHNKDIIAVGGKLGYLQIVDIKGNGRILLHARGHITDLISLSWCPVINDVFDANGAKVGSIQLLATGALERNICIWDTNRKSERILTLPNSPMAGNMHRKKPSPSWICVKWVDSNKLLSSSQFGELVCWKLNQQSMNNIKHELQTRINVEPEILHDCHSKQLFSIGCPTFYREIDLKADKVGIWSLSADKFVVYYSLNSRKVECVIPTIGGVVHCLALSVCDSNRLAIGTGDNKVLIWNIYDTSKLDVSIHWNKIIGKVLSLAWHPSEEHILACGTSFGRVVLLDVRPGKESTEFRLCHQEMVHKLHWAPPLMHTDTDTESTSKQRYALALFAVADGKIFQYDVYNANKEPDQLDEVLKNADFSSGHSSVLPRCNIAFKPDKTVFAVGNFDGSIHVIKCKELLRICTIYAHRKSLYSLVWHPETVASYNDISPYRNWLAAAAESIRVYDIQENTAHLVADLATHSAKITCVAWSHHFNARLVSASYDTSVQVWDVLQKTLLGTYTIHKNHVMACVFSPFDPYLIISGASDYTVKVWSMTEEHVSQPLSKVTKRSILAAQKRGAGIEAVETVQSVQSVSAANSKHTVSEHRRGTRKNLIFPVLGKQLQTASSIDKFYNSWLENQMGISDANKLCTLNLANSSKEEFINDSISYMDFFGKREATRNILKIEEKNLADSGIPVHSQYLALWRGDVTEMIQEAMKKKKLNEWVVSVAASASYKVWKETCEAFAAQLAEEGHYIKASTYLLALNKIEEAVDLLVEQKLFMEAVAIAKCRLPENNPIVESIFKKWGDYSKCNGRHQLAAHCYIASGNLLTASDVLARSSDLKSLMLSAVLAAQAGAHDLANSRAKECLNISLKTKNWHIAEMVLTKYADLKYYTVWFEASKMISSLKKKKKLSSEIFQWLHGESPCYSQMLLESLKTSFTCSESMYTKLNEEVVKIQSSVYEKEMWHYVSGQLATATAAFCNSGRVNAHVIRHVIKALAATDDFHPTKHESAPSIQVCFWLSPKGPLSEDSIFILSHEAEDEELSKSLFAYLGSIVCKWLTAVADEKSVPEGNDKTKGENKADHKKFDADFKWLLQLIETCFPYMFDKESIEYFKIKIRRDWVLEQKSKIMSKKTAFIKKPDKQDTKNKQKTKNKKSITFTGMSHSGIPEIAFTGTKEEVDEMVCGKSIFEILGQPTQEDLALVSQEDCVPLKESLVQNIEDDILVENGDVNECDLLQSGDTSDSEYNNLCLKENGCDNDGDKRTFEEVLCVDDNKTTETTLNDNSVLDEDIQHYDIIIQQFEKKRVLVPNPFVAYSELKTVISNYIVPYDLHMAKILNEKCDNIYESVVEDNSN